MVRTDTETMATALAAHHRGLQKALENIIVRCEGEGDGGGDASNGGDVPVVRPAWETFERELLRHLELEDSELLPLFAESYPHEAAGLNREHDEIRRQVFELGVALDLHQLRQEALQQLADLLRAHAAREDLALYPWLEMNLSADAWHTLGHALPLTSMSPEAVARRS